MAAELSRARDAPRRLAAGTLTPALARVAKIIADVYALMHDREPRPGIAPSAAEADLVEARLMASHWQERAVRAEAQLAGFETRLARAEMTALELRSRVVCLHGKLATSTATTRYQSLTLALGARMAVAEPAMAQD